MQWNPGQYERFRGPRERPGQDLLAGLPPDHQPHRIVDLGCGTGYLTRRLATRFAGAMVVGLDSDTAMLAKAAHEPSDVAWDRGDIGQWRPDLPPDLIFSNAALHWLPDHAALFPRLAGHLAPGGVLAVQMPRNFEAPSHRLLLETAADGPWAALLAGVLDHQSVLSPAAYWRILRPVASRIDLWETDYLHVLEGDDPVLEWTSGTALLPVTSRLPADQAADFRAAYGARLRAAYPAEKDGRTLFPFRRLFIVAQI